MLPFLILSFYLEHFIKRWQGLFKLFSYKYQIFKYVRLYCAHAIHELNYLTCIFTFKGIFASILNIPLRNAETHTYVLSVF